MRRIMALIMAYDRQQWKDFMENRKYIELCKEELEAEKAILDEAKAGVDVYKRQGFPTAE